jgi:hypothetical protein
MRVERRLECAEQSSPIRFQLAELAQQHQIAPRFNIVPHRVRRRESTRSVEMARGRAGSEVLKYREPFSIRDTTEETGAAGAIGKTVILRDQASQPNGMSPPRGYRPKYVLDLRAGGAANHGDPLFDPIHDQLQSPAVGI